MIDAVTKARLLESRAAAEREENRRKFPTTARLMEQFKMFNPIVVEARENGNYVVNRKIINPKEKKVIPFVWTEECVRRRKEES